MENTFHGTMTQQKNITLHYLKHSLKNIAKQKKIFNRAFECEVDDSIYDEIENMASEAREKLKEIRPLTIGQASRISGVSPADVSVLLIYIEQQKRK